MTAMTIVTSGVIAGALSVLVLLAEYMYIVVKEDDSGRSFRCCCKNRGSRIRNGPMFSFDDEDDEEEDVIDPEDGASSNAQVSGAKFSISESGDFSPEKLESIERELDA